MKSRFPQNTNRRFNRLRMTALHGDPRSAGHRIGARSSKDIPIALSPLSDHETSTVRRRTVAIVAITVFLIATNWRSLLKFVAPDFHSDLLGSLSQWQRREVEAITWVTLCCVGLWVVYRKGLGFFVSELGMRSEIMRPFVFALLLAFGTTLGIRDHVTVAGILHLAIISPLVEELLYRGYLFRQLYRRAGWSFGVTIVVTAIAFGLAHVAFAFSNGGWLRALGVVGITGIGGAFFAWLFVRWSDNLWVPFAFHALMNLWWHLFDVDTDALGGWLANGARILTIVLAIVLTLLRDTIWKSLSKKDIHEP
jgi:uncharacterized protein